MVEQTMNNYRLDNRKAYFSIVITLAAITTGIILFAPVIPIHAASPRKVDLAGQKLRSVFIGIKPDPRYLQMGGNRNTSLGCGKTAVSAVGVASLSSERTLRPAVLRGDNRAFLSLVQGGGCNGHYVVFEWRPCNYATGEVCGYWWGFQGGNIWEKGWTIVGPVCTYGLPCDTEAECWYSGGGGGGGGWDPDCLWWDEYCYIW